MILRAFLTAVLVAGWGCGRSPETGDRGGVPDAQGSRDTTAATTDWSIVPGVRAGAIRPDTDERSLAAAYGASQVLATRVPLGEGETAPGVLLFPDQPDRRLQIVWADSAGLRRPARIVLRGERSRWTLPAGVSLGTSLAELESKNGGPFMMAGFAWDYAGAVTSWRGGALDSALAPGVRVYLEPRIEHRSGPEYRKVQGDRIYLSSLPAMRAVEPRVYQILVEFPQGAAETARSEEAPAKQR